MRCPCCKMTDVARAEAVWEQNTHAGSSRTTGIGIGIGGISVGAGKTKSRSASLAAAALAPPKDTRSKWLALTILGALFIVPLFLTVPMWLYSRGTYKTALEGWKRTWYCLRCGTKGDQSAFDEGQASVQFTPY